MKRQRAPRVRRREGYVSLLAMSFVLGLALFGAALAVSLRAYLAAAADETRDIRTRIALESAAATVLGEMAAGGTISSRRETAFNTDRQSISVMVTGVKVDPTSDSARTVVEAGRAASLVIDPELAATAGGLAELSARHRLNASQEDCLRRVLTYGRGGAPRVDQSAELEGFAIRAGDQVDLRVQAASGPVLWLRARFTGGETGWILHDHRLLRGVVACP